jgi:flagellar hook assembly protein FlgD
MVYTTSTITDSENDNTNKPTTTELFSNYPNPFNPTTTINFYLNEKNHVMIDIFNIKGQKINTLTDKFFEIGSHSVIWDGLDGSGHPASSGVYFYRLKTDKFESVKKMILMK